MNVNRATNEQVLTTLRTTYQLAHYARFSDEERQIQVASLLNKAIRILEDDVNHNEERN
jgi:hypothetical protein